MNDLSIIQGQPAHAEWCWYLDRVGDVMERRCSKSNSCPGCAWNSRHAQLPILLDKMAGQDIYTFPKPATDGAWRGVCQTIKTAGCEYVAMFDVVFTNHIKGELVATEDLSGTLERALMAIPPSKKCRPSEGWCLYAPRLLLSDHPGTEALAEVEVPFDPFTPEPEPLPRYRYKMSWCKVLTVSKQLGYDFPRIRDSWDGNWRWDCSCLPAEGTRERLAWAEAVGEYQVVDWSSYQNAA